MDEAPHPNQQVIYASYNYFLNFDHVESHILILQVSRTLEYTYDDYVIAQIAKLIGNTEDYLILMNHSNNFKNVLDDGSGGKILLMQYA
jgi:putative alpha-1,2-mannosidase